MLKYKIVLVPFPFDDLSNIKVRPAICLTNPIGFYNHIVLAFISSKILEEIAESDFVILDEKGFNQTGLLVSSTIRLHRLVTLPTNLLKRELGFLPNNMVEKIKNRLKELFEL